MQIGASISLQQWRDGAESGLYTPTKIRYNTRVFVLMGADAPIPA